MQTSDAVEIFRHLVSIDSTSERSNLPVVDYIVDLFERRSGVTIEYDRDEGANKANLLIRIGRSDETRRGVILSGHMDCVPARESSWESDPFQLSERDDRWVARGASDMKGFLALAVAAALQVRAETLRAPLVLLFTYDEEVGTLGAHHFVQHYGDPSSLPRNVIIGEPTSLRVVRMNKGHLKMRVTISGKSAHSGYPHLGRNAIEAAAPVIAAISALRAKLESEKPPHGEFFAPVSYVTLNAGTIHGGSAVNVVPDSCTIELGARLLPGMHADDMLARLRAAVTEVAPDVEVSLISNSPPLLLDESAPVHREMCEMRGQSGTESVSFATDAGWLQSLDLDCVLWGPGSIEVAHRPNEFMPKAEFRAARELLPRIIERFCGA